MATAQVTIQPKSEIFGGYSWLGISGQADLGVKAQDINTGFEASYTYYFPFAHNLGVIFDGSGHFNTGNISHNHSKTITAPTKPGTYHYICNIHQYMMGTIKVS